MVAHPFCQSFSATRSFALRARGFSSSSAGPETIGLRVTSFTSRLFAADAHREFRRAGAALCAACCIALLTMRSSSEWKVMTASRAAGIQAADRSLHHAADGAELIVDGDADGLKASLCRVLLFAQRLRGHGRADDVHQLQRRFDRVPSRARGRWLRRSAVHSAPRRNHRECGRSSPCGQVLTTSPAVSTSSVIHAHIERRVRHVGKAARSIVELRRRKRRGRTACRPRPAMPKRESRIASISAKIAVHERHAVGIGASAAPPPRASADAGRGRRRSDVRAPSGGGQISTGMSCAAQRAVQIDAVRADVQRVNALLQQYGLMLKFHQKPELLHHVPPAPRA